VKILDRENSRQQELGQRPDNGLMPVACTPVQSVPVSTDPPADEEFLKTAFALPIPSQVLSYLHLSIGVI